ncbi:MAG: glycyl radical protein [Bacteroidales bacterium]|nr:glycyl radical protein [Bacteroidales bacterium]MCF8345022.1 glycyl radical protein [Bacteroidales bacterium]MCF8352488.1 glycyl radical protein [Bacteroidales bacterium]MCF8377903.1 glycyl radical protein [Bacteroidales bacterium]MCF8402285.1 glycyl radical protein [Bacteroidales bacterium]
MKERIKILREESQSARASLSHERAVLITDFYNSDLPKGKSISEQRALAFKYIMENKSIFIGPNELIVGERGEKPKATPTYPEICLHSTDDLQMLDAREKQNFAVSEETREIYREKIIPFWKGKSMRERIFEEMPDDWKAAYEAGVFTEFLEQRAPGHTVLGRDMFHKGFRQLQQEIDEAIEQLDYYDDPEALARLEELRAMHIAAEAIIRFAERHAGALKDLAMIEQDTERKRELFEMERICRKVPAEAPETFHEALQHYWFIHQGVITELNPWDSFNPGRLDQNLYPFYKKEVEDGSLSKEKAKELLQAFWVKFNNHPSPPKIGVTAQESSTYTDFSLINLGGLTEQGRDGVNDLTYLILEVIEEMRLLQPSSMVQVSHKNPDEFIRRALGIIKTGFGQPSVFNTDAIIEELLRQGKKLTDARNGGSSGCVETGAFGKESYILTGYFNLVKVLEITLNNGLDPRSGKQIGLKTGEPADYHSFEVLMDAYEKQLKHFINIKIKGNNIIEQLYARYLPVPFLSLLIGDCIQNGTDYNAGGARYNSTYIQGVGTGSITDNLSAIRTHVFEKKSFTMDSLMKALKNDFRDYEELRELLISDSPKYGNDDEQADELTQKVFDMYFRAIDGRPNTKGGHYRINLLPTTSHVYFGSVIGAMPDGRHAGEPLSEGISPVQGADRLGPTAVLKSAARIDHIKTGGTLLNQKFSPQFFEEEKGMESIVHLIRAYFKMKGHHIQFNVVTAENLRKARKEPEKYRDLIVRVAGYSDYFIDLTPELQEEIIRRTEHEGG